MNIVIFSGGTGSTNLQKGLYEVFDKDVINYTVITNLYDNGLSTGKCRKLYKDKILGPSDLRKNHLLRHELIHGKTVLYKFLELRISIEDNLKAIDFIKESLFNLFNNNHITKKKYYILSKAIEYFVLDVKLDKPIFDDFSVANLIYSSLMYRYGVENAISLMESVLDIPKDSVVVSAYEPYFLHAFTKNGYKIEDEGEIVKWCNSEDPIINCCLSHKGLYVPAKISEKCYSTIVNADIIIFSPGTQWSSLIPTYKTQGIIKAFSETKAKKYLITNVSQDKDMRGIDIIGFLSTVCKFLPFKLEDLVIVSSSLAESEMVISENILTQINKIFNFKDIIIKDISNKKAHLPKELVLTIFSHYFNVNYDKMLIFDFDDTLVSRDEQLKYISYQNCNMINKLNNVCVCTGNTIKKLVGFFDCINVFSNRGLDFYHLSLLDYSYVKCLDDKFKLSEEDIMFIKNTLIDLNIDTKLIDIRDNTIIAIKPIVKQEREFIVNLLKDKFINFDTKSVGRSTIEISKIGLDKDVILKHYSSFTFIGDECDGNDKPLTNKHGVDFIKVSGVEETNMLLTIILYERAFSNNSSR